MTRFPSASDWTRLESELAPAEEEYRRQRVRAGGARELSDAEHETLVDRLQDAVELYLSAPDELRERMRAFFRGTDFLARRLGYVFARGREAVETGPAEGLERAALLALGTQSLGDVPNDYRDAYIAIGSLYHTLHRRGVALGPLLARVALLSSDAPARGAPGSTRDFLATFERSAHFRTSVAPYLDRAELPRC